MINCRVRGGRAADHRGAERRARPDPRREQPAHLRRRHPGAAHSGGRAATAPGAGLRSSRCDWPACRSPSGHRARPRTTCSTTTSSSAARDAADRCRGRLRLHRPDAGTTSAPRLRAAAAQRPAELWLVVDHNDELLARARTELVAELPVLQVLANSRRQGLSGARNAALERVRADVVVFLDDDAIPSRAGWRRCTGPYADPSVIAVGGVAQPRWPTQRGRRLPCRPPDRRAPGRSAVSWTGWWDAVTRASRSSSRRCAT